MVGYSNDNYTGRPIDYDEVVGEASQDDSLCAAFRMVGKRKEGERFVLQEVQRSFYCIMKLCAKPGTFTLVPGTGFGSLIRSLRQNHNLAHYWRPILARILCANSVRLRSWACPASICAIRLRISASQASATSPSCGASRLLISSWASSAR